MQNSVIRKMEKARQYAEQKERVAISSINTTFHGIHSDHHVAFKEGKWSCTCAFFSGYATCSHTMALERILGPMLAANRQRQPIGYPSS